MVLCFGIVVLFYGLLNLLGCIGFDGSGFLIVDYCGWGVGRVVMLFDVVFGEMDWF